MRLSVLHPVSEHDGRPLAARGAPQVWFHQRKKLINSLDANGVGALHVAAALGLCDIAAYLLDCNGSPTFVDQQGLTPLHWACRYSQAEVLPLLLSDLHG